MMTAGTLRDSTAIFCFSIGLTTEGGLFTLSRHSTHRIDREQPTAPVHVLH